MNHIEIIAPIVEAAGLCWSIAMSCFAVGFTSLLFGAMLGATIGSCILAAMALAKHADEKEQAYYDEQRDNQHR